MKRIFTFFSFLLFAYGAMAQIHVESFAQATSGEALTAQKRDHNGDLCALIKVTTTNLDDYQRKRLSFNTDKASKIVEVTYPVGAIYIFISPDAEFLEISHPDFSVMKYNFRVKIAGNRDYEMRIRGASVTTLIEDNITENWVVMNITPADAKVEIDNEVLLMQNGSGKSFLKLGKHAYSVSSPMYHIVTGEFEITPDNTTELNITLKPNFGYIKVESLPENGAVVFIDDKKVGVTPFTTQRLESKLYKVQVAKEMYKTVEQVVEVKDNETVTVQLDMNANFAEPTFTTDAESEIWINGEKKGKGRWSSRLPAGAYRLEAKRESHRTVSRSITLANGDNQIIAIDPPTPIYGRLNISSLPVSGAEIVIDGQSRGTTPSIISNLLIGRREIKLVKEGYAPTIDNVVIEEGKITEKSITLSSVRNITIEGDNGHDIYMDGQFLGTGLFNGSVNMGEHNFELRKGRSTVYTQTVNISSSTHSPLRISKTGSLILSLSPSNAYVTIAGSTYGNSKTHYIDKGSHQVTISASGYESQRETVTLDESPVKLTNKLKTIREVNLEKGRGIYSQLDLTNSYEISGTGSYTGTVTFSFGYHINKYFKVGAGVGASYISSISTYYEAGDDPVNPSDGIPVLVSTKGGIAIPCYLQLGGFLTKGTIAPYWTFDIGAKITTTKGLGTGIFASPTIGVALKKWRIGVSYQFSPKGHLYNNNWSAEKPESLVDDHSIGLKIGYQF